MITRYSKTRERIERWSVTLIAAVLLMTGRAAGEDILVVTDIHFNPFAACCGTTGTSAEMVALARNNDVSTWRVPEAAAATYHQETTTATWASGLAEISRVVKARKITKIFVCGDLLEHAFDKDFQTYIREPRSMAAFSSNVILYQLGQLGETTGAEIYYILGNNDSDRGDYVFPSRAFRQNLARGLFGQAPPALRKEFAELGYTARPLNDHLEIIGLNGGLMTLSNPMPSLAARQVKLLRRDLERCRQTGRRAIILMHEPFGIDPYASFYAKTAISVFNTDCQRACLDALLDYADVVSTVYTGHYHMEYLISLGGKIPLVGTIALNSFFGNNPGFKVISIDNRTGRLIDTATYVKKLSQPRSAYAPLYGFHATYDPSARSVIDIINDFPSNPAERVVQDYRALYNGRSPDREWITSPQGWPYYFTSMRHLDPASFTAFIRKKFPQVEYHAPAAPAKAR